MPTDEERREVAARLRYMAPGSDWPNYVAEACGMDVSKMSNNFHTFTEQLCQRIADLIDPEERTCRNVSDDKRWFICSGCGTHVRGGSCCHSYVDDAGTRWYTTAYKSGLNFCQNCDARVVDE